MSQDAAGDREIIIKIWCYSSCDRDRDLEGLHITLSRGFFLLVVLPSAAPCAGSDYDVIYYCSYDHGLILYEVNFFFPKARGDGDTSA